MPFPTVLFAAAATLPAVPAAFAAVFIAPAAFTAPAVFAASGAASPAALFASLSTGVNLAPHLGQNTESSGNSAPHWSQNIFFPPYQSRSFTYFIAYLYFSVSNTFISGFPVKIQRVEFPAW